MASNRITIESVRSDLQGFLKLYENNIKYTCSIEIQKSKVKDCESLLTDIKDYKEQAKAAKLETIANELFYYQCMINSVKSSHLIWISLKNGDNYKSWCHLIDAQDYVSVALKICDDDHFALTLRNNLKKTEAIIFPEWPVYNSPGFRETVGVCSICGQNFILCEHIENEIYFGTLCLRVNRKVIEGLHSAIVKNPRDRRCIVTSISDDEGYMIDCFTGEKTGEFREIDSDSCGHMTAAILSTKALDVF
ncbi:hypothetical protein [Pseudoalteromonas piscicida]|uniref:hypothetical protein n=1 Tax=Pseudoalteromonas piscicida TaxID=43662 RepID=UPI0030AF26D1